MMDRNEVIRMLEEKGIAYEKQDHPAVFTVEDADAFPVPYPEGAAKNLFLRDSKKREYFLITVHDRRSVDLKALRAQLGTKPLSFTSEEDLMALLKLSRGAVTPLGLLNDTDHRVRWLLGAELQGQKIGVHPLDNTATLWLATEDLLSLLAQAGIEPVIF